MEKSTGLSEGKLIATVTANLDNFDTSKKLEIMRERPTTIANKKIGNDMKTMCEIVYQTYSAVVVLEKSNYLTYFRFQGVEEDQSRAKIKVCANH